MPELEEVVEALSPQLTLQQHFGLGKVAVMLMLVEDPKLKVADAGKRLDAYYFATATPELGIELSRGQGQALFEVRRLTSSNQLVNWAKSIDLAS